MGIFKGNLISLPARCGVPQTGSRLGLETAAAAGYTCRLYEMHHREEIPFEWPVGNPGTAPKHPPAYSNKPGTSFSAISSVAGCCRPPSTTKRSGLTIPWTTCPIDTTRCRIMNWAAFGVWASSTAAPSSGTVIPSRLAAEPVATKILISPTRAANARFPHPLHTLTASNGTQGSLDTSTSYVISTSVRQRMHHGAPEPQPLSRPVESSRTLRTGGQPPLRVVNPKNKRWRLSASSAWYSRSQFMLLRNPTSNPSTN